ncbi:MAG TPA: peptidylprolyl isomerase [Planctomycetaceae bacterium]|nr:peptidylprolyl isomerase [Planctomycetaceae bacterium]
MTRIAGTAWACVLLGGLCGFCDAADSSAVVATVNGVSITEGDVEFFGFSRGLSPDEQKLQRPRLVEQLIERQLVRGFLAAKKITPDADAIEQQTQVIQQMVVRRGEKPDALFKRLGLTSERLKAEIGLPLAWKAYIEQSTPPDEIRKIFNDHRPEYDGTRVRVRQIFRRAADDTARVDADALLTKVRKEVESKAMGFDGAVRAYSQAPSVQNGGDVGWISRRGQLPDVLTEAVWKLAPGEIAGPLKSPFGVHLIQVTDREPGQLSVEDARPQILERICAQRWTEIVTAERANAKIVRP